MRGHAGGPFGDPATVLDGEIYVSRRLRGRLPGPIATIRRPIGGSGLADLPVETNHPGITTLGGRVIVAGGYAMNGASAHRGIWAYDPDDDAWEAIGELPEPMGAFGSTTLDDEPLTWSAARWGRSTGEPSAAVWRRAGDGSWEERAPLAHAREHLAVVARDEQIYAVGGRAHGRDSDQLGSAVERYDPTADKWDLLALLPHPRSGLNGRRRGLPIVWSWPAVRRATGLCRRPDARRRRRTLGIAARSARRGPWRGRRLAGQ